MILIFNQIWKVPGDSATSPDEKQLFSARDYALTHENMDFERVGL